MARLVPAACIAALCLAHTALAEPAYRWRDAGGLVHFGDRPPPGVGAEALPVPALDSPPGDSAAEIHGRWQKLLDDPRLKADWRRQSAEKRRARSREARAEARREKRCRRMEQELERLEARLRGGYRPKTGVRLDERRRERREEWRRECR